MYTDGRPALSTVCLTCGAVGWALLLLLNVVILAAQIDLWAHPLYTAGVGLVVTVTVVGVQLRSHSAAARDRAAIVAMIAAYSPTRPLPLVRAVGSASIPDEAGGYARGYLDGLHAQPAGSAKVLPFGR